MATKYIVDTHALIWHFEGNSLLGASAKAVTSNPNSELILPAVALAEAMFIVEKGRCLLTSVRDLLDDVHADNRINIFPLTSGILEESASLTIIPEIHDRLIVATGVYLQNLGETIEILTKDKIITASALLTVCEVRRCIAVSGFRDRTGRRGRGVLRFRVKTPSPTLKASNSLSDLFDAFKVGGCNLVQKT